MKSTLKREVDEETAKIEEDLEEKEELLEDFKRLKLLDKDNDVVHDIVLVRRNESIVEVSPAITAAKPWSSSVKLNQVAKKQQQQKKTLKRIEDLTKEKLKAALRKRRIKGFPLMNKDELMKRSKKEIKS